MVFLLDHKTLEFHDATSASAHSEGDYYVLPPGSRRFWLFQMTLCFSLLHNYNR